MKIKKSTPTPKSPKAAAKAVAKAAKAAAPKTPTVAVPAPAPETPAPAAKAAPTAKAVPTASRNVSKEAFAYPPFNGRHARIMEFQDFTFALNASRPTPLTDTELAAVWQAQFPRAVTFTAKHVAGAHRDFLVNRHSRTFAGWTAETAIDQLRPYAARLTPDGVQPMVAVKAAKAVAA